MNMKIPDGVQQIEKSAKADKLTEQSLIGGLGAIIDSDCWVPPPKTLPSPTIIGFFALILEN